jgi:hypothetical protein
MSDCEEDPHQPGSYNIGAVSPPLISIVVPVRRTHLPYLEACLRSVARQTAVRSCELVVVDDASGRAYAKDLDRAVSIVDGVVATERVTLPRRCGPGGARAAGAEVSRGRYLLFLDSDDLLDPRMVEAVTPALDAGAAMAYTNEARVTADGGTVITVRDKRPYAALLETHAGSPFDPMVHATFVCHGQVIRRGELEAIGGPRTDLEYGDEMDRPIRVAEISGPAGLTLVPETLYLYRRNPASIVHQPAEWEVVVSCIERIVAEGAQRRGLDVARAVRLGRAKPSDLTHYGLYDARGKQLRAPYVDYDELSLRPPTGADPSTAAS